MTESMLETSSQPGLILRAAREEMSLSIEQVAQELHLRPAVVKAIEEENYSEFSSDVFLKGYFRTYCRLVKLHEERMIEMLEKQLSSIKQASDKSQEQQLKARHSRKRRKQLVTLAIFLFCASLVYLAYLLSTESSIVSSGNTETHVAQTSESDTTQKTETVEVKAMHPKGEEQSSTGLTDNTRLQEDTFPESFDQAELKAIEKPEEEVDETGLSAQDAVSADSETSDKVVYQQLQAETATPEIAEIPESDNLASLTALFTGDCWFKLTDGNGKTAIADLKRENDQINYQGIPPFHIVIGDASKASLTFNGETIDLARYSSRNGRAELNLNTKDAQTRAE